MSKFEEEIIDLIDAQAENDQVDFKKEYYSKEKKYDLIKDIVSPSLKSSIICSSICSFLLFLLTIL